MGAIPKRCGTTRNNAGRLMNPTSRVRLSSSHRLPASASQWPLKLQPEKLSSKPSPKGLWIEPFEATLPGSSSPRAAGLGGASLLLQTNQLLDRHCDTGQKARTRVCPEGAGLYPSSGLATTVSGPIQSHPVKGLLGLTQGSTRHCTGRNPLAPSWASGARGKPGPSSSS